MLTFPQHRRALRTVGLVLGAVAGLGTVLVLGTSGGARAAASEVRLLGTNGPDYFLVHPVSSTQVEFCGTNACFLRLKSEVADVVVDGLDGDDVLVVSHGSGFLTNSTGDLPISFVAGVGSDSLVLCAQAPEPCTQQVTTVVSPSPEPDERTLVQCLGAQPGGVCQPGPATMRITVRGAATIQDMTPGPLTVVGGATADVVTVDSTRIDDDNGDPATVGRVLVNSSAPYVYGSKRSLTVETTSGPDHTVIRDARGFSAPVGSCAATASVPLCVRSDGTDDDRVVLAAGAGRAEDVRLTPRAGGALVTGAAVAGAVDLMGQDRIDLAQQAGDLDLLTLTATTGNDNVLTAPAPSGVVISGQLGGAGPPFELPVITVTGDGSGPARVRVDALAGSDRLTATGTDTGDTVTLRTGAGGCGAVGVDCLEQVAPGHGGYRATTSGVEQYVSDTGAGDDRLTVAGDVAAAVQSSGGDGADALAFAGTGQHVTLDLAAGTITQGAGTVTASGAERFDAYAAQHTLTVRAAAGDDAVNVAPTGASSAILAMAGDPRVVHAAGLASPLVVDAGAGGDEVTVEGTTAGEDISVDRGAGILAGVAGAVAVQIAPSAEAVSVRGAAGDDRFLVTGSAGPVNLRVDGGPQATDDTVILSEAGADATVAPGTVPGSGTLTADGPPIAFVGVEQVAPIGTGTGTVTVLGSDGDDVVTQAGDGVTVGRGLAVRWDRFSAVALPTGAGDDQVVLAPATLSPGVTLVAVDADAGGGDAVLVQGTAAGETLTYTADGPAAARMSLSSATALVTMTGTEAVRADGAGSTGPGDDLVIATPATTARLVHEPAAAHDAGRVLVQDGTGAGDLAPPLAYGGLGAGRVVFAGAAEDDVVARGTTGNDNVTVSPEPAVAGVLRVTADGRVPLVLPGARVLELDGLDGEDSFRVPADHPLVGDGGPAIRVHGGSPDAGDLLRVTAVGSPDGPVVLDAAARTVTQTGHEPIAYDGLARVAVDASGQALTVAGSPGPDSVTFEPTAPDGGTVTSAGLDSLLTLLRVGTLTVDPTAGADAVTVLARAAADDVTVARGSESLVTVADLLPVRVAASTESIRVDGGDGPDTLLVTGGGSAAQLTVDGGLPALDGDVVRVVARTVAVRYATDPHAGSLQTTGGPLSFVGADTLDVHGDDDPSGRLTVEGTDAPDALTVGDPALAPQVRVNGGANVRYTDYPTLVLAGRGARDAVTVASGGLGDITRLHVAGGTAADDHVTVVDSADATRTYVVRPSAPDAARVETAGEPVIDVSGMVGLLLNGRDGGDTLKVLSPPGADGVTVTPGAAADAGQVRSASTLPVDFTGIGTAGRVVLDDSAAAAVDHVTLTTTTRSDTVAVRGDLAELQLTGFVPVVARGTADVAVLGGEGADAFAVTAPLPWTATVDGGADDDRMTVPGDLGSDLRWLGGEGQDALAFSGTGAPVSVDLASGAVTQGDGTATATATEQFDLAAAGRSLTVTGTRGIDVLDVQPTTTTAAVVRRADDTRVINGSGIGGTLVVDPRDGDDVVSVHGTTASEDLAVDRSPSSLITQVGNRVPVRLLPSADAVSVLGGLGNDQFLLAGTGGPLAVTLDGGPQTGGDSLISSQVGPDATVALAPVPGAGSLSAGGPPVAFLGVEHVDAQGDGTGRLAVLGGDGDDVVTQLGNVVTLGRGTWIGWSAFTELALSPGAGDDQVLLSPATTIGVTGTTVDAGPGQADSVLVRGTAVKETITWTVDGPTAARVAMSGAPAVTAGAVEAVHLDGATTPPSGDTLVISTPTMAATLVHEPGSTFDSGSVAVSDASGMVTSAPAMDYTGLGTGRVVFDGTPSDTVVVRGQTDNDVFTVVPEPGTSGTVSRVTLDSRVPVSVPGARVLDLDGLDGEDVFRVPADHALPSTDGPAVRVHGGSPDDGDALVVTAAAGGARALTVDAAARTLSQAGHRAIGYDGLARVELDAAEQSVSVSGGTGPDAFAYQPTAVDAATLGSPLLGGLLTLTRVGALSIDPNEGADTVSISGRSSVDAIAVQRAAVTHVTVSGLLPLRVADSTESLAVDGREAADTFEVTGSGGPPTLSLDGADPALDGDVVRLVSPAATVRYAVDPSSGALTTPGGTVAFAGMDSVAAQGDGSGALTVEGTGAADVLSLGGPDTARVRVNGGTSVLYHGYPTLVLDGKGGRDGISVAYGGLGDLQTLRVAGGLAADDDVTVTDTTGSTRTFIARPAAADAATIAVDGQPLIDVQGAASLRLDGRLGDDSVLVASPVGPDTVTVTPGATADAGTVGVGSLLPVSFTGVGADGRVLLNDPSASPEDQVHVLGTGQADAVWVRGADGEVRVGGSLPVVARGTQDLRLLGGDGSDSFAVSGPLPWATTTLVGGGPAPGDALALDGPTGDVSVDLGRTAVTGYGGTVSFPEISDLTTTVGRHTLTEVGTPRDDAFCYDAQTPRDGRLHVVGAPGGGALSDVCLADPRSIEVLHTFLDVGRLVIDPGDGVDQVIVDGTVASDVLTVTARAPHSTVVLNPSQADPNAFRLPADIVSATTENVTIAADAGDDIIDITAYESATPLFQVHGEDPTTRRSGDRLWLRDGTGGAEVRKTASQVEGSGTATVFYRRYSGTLVRVDYDGIEDVELHTKKR